MAEDILHFGALKYRVKGSGVLRTTLKGLDSVVTQTLATYTMSSSPGIEPVLLSNLNNQRALVRIETTSIDEVFNFNRIIVYVKPIWSSYPQ